MVAGEEAVRPGPPFGDAHGGFLSPRVRRICDGATLDFLVSAVIAVVAALARLGRASANPTRIAPLQLISFPLISI
jgi:hypothetical protein